MEKYVLFGAGEYGQQMLNLIGKDKVEFFVDNFIDKREPSVSGIPIYSLVEVKDKLANYILVITVSEKYQNEIEIQLCSEGITSFVGFKEMQCTIIKNRILERTNYIHIYEKAINWIKRYTLNSGGIICNTDLLCAYPEVTGYYIPTLIQWGYRDLALSYAEWLCSIQKEDGSWCDATNQASYVFDTAQVIKGLLAIRNLLQRVDSHIKKGCEWILSNIQPNGRLITPTEDGWGNNNVCSELVHLYCLSPLIEASEVYGKSEYKEKALKVLEFYKKNYKEKILDFSLLSHFYAYVIEALIDVGEENLAREAMANMAKYQKTNGAVPAYHNVDYVCSTGLFQLSLVWFRLDNIERGNAAFRYACKLQNSSGGWYGSYLSDENMEENNTYFPTSEISWAIKYFLDALYYKNLKEFEKNAEIFLDKIDVFDGRYKLISNIISNTKKSCKILDIGCGKGRYLSNLTKKYIKHDYYAVDLSSTVMNYIDCTIKEKRQGTLTNIPYDNKMFDFVYTCEALEHAIDIENAIKELVRVTKPGGKIIIIDKNEELLGQFEIGEWEQWFNKNKLLNLLNKYCHFVSCEQNIPYEGNESDNLFLAWIATV